MPEDCDNLPTHPHRGPLVSVLAMVNPAKSQVGVNKVRVVFEDICCHAFLEATN